MRKDSAYFVEATAKTRNLGLVMSLILVPVVVAFMYLDSITTALHGIVMWRVGAIIPAVLFLAHALFVFPKRQRLTIPLHILQLAGLIVTMCGISADLATRPDFPEFAKTALISSLLICIFADFVFAAGARRYLGAILIPPLAAMSVYIIGAGEFLTQMQRIWLISNPAAMALILSILALYQERSGFREFAVRAELRRAEEALRESERKYHALFDNAQVGMFRMKPETSEIIDVNRRCLELTGRTRQDMLGTRSVIHWADAREHEEMMRLLERDGRVANFECRIVNARGEERHCLTSLSLDAEHIIEGSLLDITDRRKLEAEREAGLRRLELVIATTRTGLDIIDENLVVQYVDPARTKVMGDAKGRNCYEYFRGRSVPCEPCAVQKALETHRVQVEEQTQPGHDHRPTQVTALPYQDESGRWLVAEAIVDISERKKAEAERLDLERRIAASQRLEGLGILAGGVAHNFNNLLMVILGHAELLRESLGGDRETTSSVGEIIRAGNRSRDLVSRLLSLGKRRGPDLRPLDLNTVVRESSSMLRQALRENIAITYRLSSSPYLVAADPGRIEEVLLNLALNAQDAMPRDGQIEIATTEVVLERVFARRQADLPPGRYVQLSFSDTGEGMASETLAKIFTPFFTTKEQGKGTGLGLYTVYSIVKEHHGTIDVESRLGAGTRFVICFPRIEALALESPGSSGPQPAKGGETILLVEDEEPIRSMLSHRLRNLGYTVLEAADGISAGQVFAEYGHVVHLLVTDVIMPRMSGRDLYEQLHERMPRLKVLFMSGYPREVINTHVLRDEEIELLAKPFTGQALATRVREILDREIPAKR